MPLRTAIALLLATVPLSVSAQTPQNEQRRQVISNLKACVRTHAPEAQAAGVQTIGDPVNYFIRVCSPPITDLDPAKVGAIPPGIFRVTIREEWNTITEGTRTR
jgi:hypothetical protein